MWKKWINHYENFQDEFQDSMKRFGKIGGLRLWIICALRDEPKNGVEIMDTIQERHGSMHGNHPYAHHGRKRAWRPSPGSVYPMLKKMVEEDLVIKMEDGRYNLTFNGKEIITEVFNFQVTQTQGNRFTAEHALTEIDSYISYLEDMKEDRLIPHKTKLKTLIERLKKIENSLNED